jgi:hypothetical protein
MPQIDDERGHTETALAPSSPQEILAAENVSLRLLLTQAKLSAETLLAQDASTPGSVKLPTGFKC